MAHRSYTLKSYALVLLLVFAIAASACRQTDTDTSLDRVRGAGILAIGVDPSYPPFATYDGQGQPDGYEIELGREIAQRLGVAPAFRGFDIGSIVDAVVARKVDVIISGMVPAPEHAKQVRYSRPYFNAGQVLVVGPVGPTKIPALAGMKVGVEAGSTGEMALRRSVDTISGVQVLTYLAPEDAMADVRRGALDAAVTDVITARQLVPAFPPLRIAAPPFSNEYYVVVGRKPDATLIGAVNKIIESLANEGYLRALEEKWLS